MNKIFQSGRRKKLKTFAYPFYAKAAQKKLGKKKRNRL